MNFVEAGEKRVRSDWTAPGEQKIHAPSVWDTREWLEMQVAITTALRPHTEAWDAVSKALKEHRSKYANRT